MKDSILIDSSLPDRFWVEAIETANYLRNKLPIRTKSHKKVISKELWISQKQNL